MIAQQEELDWEVYRLYGLVDEDLTYAGDDLPELALGERAFEIALARESRRLARRRPPGSTGTARHRSPRSRALAGGYRELVQRRIDLDRVAPDHRAAGAARVQAALGERAVGEARGAGAARLAARPAGGSALLVRRAGPADARERRAAGRRGAARRPTCVRCSRCGRADPTSRSCRAWSELLATRPCRSSPPTATRTPACASARRGRHLGAAAPRGRGGERSARSRCRRSTPRPTSLQARRTGRTAASSTCPRSGSSSTPAPAATPTRRRCSAGPAGTTPSRRSRWRR